MTELQDLYLWAVSERKAIGFQHSLQKLDKLDGYYSASVMLNFDGKDIVGSFISQDRTIATGVAIVEALERVAMRAHDLKNSNGLAAHFDLNIAQENSRRELLERDAFLWAFHWQQQLNELQPEFSQFRLFELPVRDNFLKGILCYGEGEKPTFSLSVSSTAEEAKKKSYLDALVLQQYIDAVNPPALSLQEFLNTEKLNVHHHAQLSFSSDYKNALGSWPLKSQSLKKRQPLKESFLFREVELPDPFKPSGVRVVHGIHPELLNYYVGPVSELTSQQSYQRLALEYGEATLMLPHPFN